MLMAACRRSAPRTASSDTHGEGAEFATPDRIGFQCDGRHLLLGGSAAAWPLQQRRGGFNRLDQALPVGKHFGLLAHLQRLDPI
jgi:hypothetical protein